MPPFSSLLLPHRHTLFLTNKQTYTLAHEYCHTHFSLCPFGWWVVVSLFSSSYLSLTHRWFFITRDILCGPFFLSPDFGDVLCLRASSANSSITPPPPSRRYPPRAHPLALLPPPRAPLLSSQPQALGTGLPDNPGNRQTPVALEGHKHWHCCPGFVFGVCVCLNANLFPIVSSTNKTMIPICF